MLLRRWARGVDDDRPDDAVLVGEARVVELPEQLVAQRFLGPGQCIRAASLMFPDGSSSPVLARRFAVHLEHVVRFEQLLQLAPELE